MKDLSNKEIYNFLEQEIALHPEIPNKCKCNIQEKENDAYFWEELNGYLDCFRICDVCKKPMIEGYYLNGTHYCSDKCAHLDFTDEEIKDLCQDDNSDNYYSVWYEDSIIYKQKNIK